MVGELSIKIFHLLYVATINAYKIRLQLNTQSCQKQNILLSCENEAHVNHAHSVVYPVSTAHAHMVDVR
ncbi:hypothetical protein F2P79_011593 [Pimephales promelas]|nr:hypothetical protein F2P79_011593 [Pimephales promelas]